MSYPGTATLSSGYTQQLARNAVVCDQARLLNRLSAISNCTSPVPRITKAAVASSVLELNAATRCVPTPEEFAQYPKVGVPESVRIQRVAQDVILCSQDELNPLIRNVIPVVVCPATPTEQLNSTQPKPSFNVCQPSRFY